MLQWTKQRPHDCYALATQILKGQGLKAGVRHCLTAFSQRHCLSGLFPAMRMRVRDRAHAISRPGDVKTLTA